MKEIVSVEKRKKVYQLSFEEFKKGDWIKELPDSELLDINYMRKQKVLIVKWANMED